METAGVCEIDVATRRIVGGSDSPPDLDSPSQVNTIKLCFLSVVFCGCSLICHALNVAVIYKAAVLFQYRCFGNNTKTMHFHESPHFSFLKKAQTCVLNVLQTKVGVRLVAT